jgi:hypothetical protein
VIEKCQQGEHDLIWITKHGCEVAGYETVRWCITCGSIVVDIDIDNRTLPGEVMQMRTPVWVKTQLPSIDG